MRRRVSPATACAGAWCWLALHTHSISAFSTAPNDDARRATESPPLRQLSIETPPDSASLFTESRRQSTRRRKRRPPAAPLVDSALLRFLSAEKKQQQQQDILQQQEDAIQKQQEDGITQERGKVLTATKTGDDTVDADSGTDSAARSSVAGSSLRPAENWLGQYNANRVTQTLLQCGKDSTSRSDNRVEMELAQRAGEAVQRHVLARTARRRVREFLRQRDLQWIQEQRKEEREIKNATKPVSSLGSQSLLVKTSVPASSSLERRISLQPREYGLEDKVSFLMDIGLTLTDVCTILTHTPSIALMRPKQTVMDGPDDVDGGSSVREGIIVTNTEEDRVETLETTATRAFQEVLCDSLKLRRYDARKVLRNCPGLMTTRGSKTAQQIVSLLSSLGVSTSSLARDKTGLPVLLSRSPEALFRLVAFLSSDAVRMPVGMIGPLMRRNECLELLNAVAPVPRLQHEQDTMTQRGLQNDSIPTSVSALWGKSGVQERREQVNAMYRLMSSTAWTLRYKIGTEDLGKVIAAYPSVLLLDAETQVLPVAEYLMNELGIWQDDLPRVLQLYPILLGMDVDEMKRVVSYMLALDVDEESLASIFRAFPSLLTLDVEKDMRPVVEFVRGIGITNIGRFITRLPPVLGYSVEHELVPKWEYLSRVSMDPRFQLSAFPAYFSYPLDKVRARYEYLRGVKRIPSQMIALDLILRYGDRDFATKVARDQDGGEIFINFVENATTRRADGRSRGVGKRRKAKPPPATASSRPQRGGTNEQQ